MIKATIQYILDIRICLYYYWIGFILADGSIKNNKRIVISLKKDDKDHLEKFKQYVKSKTLRINDVYCSTSLQQSQN